jgi:Sec-independent protein secretion pathway component TatC
MFNWAFKKIVKLREKVAVDLGDKDVEKPFLDHLDDLRTMLVRMCVTLLVVTLGTFFFYQELLALIRYPLVLADIADKIILQNFKVTGGFMTVMNISLVTGLILAFPVLLYFLLQFVLPGLRSNEKKVLFPALGVGGGLFLLGVVFAYYVVTPRALSFFYEFSVGIGTGAGMETPAAPHAASSGAEQRLANEFGILWENTNPGVRNTIETSADGETWSALAAVGPDGNPVETKEIRFVRIISAPVETADGVAAGGPPGAAPAAGTLSAVPVGKPFIWELTEYVKFICQFVLIFGLCFELPVVVMALVKLDVLNYKVMKGSRTWAAIIICVVAAIITPTQDALTLGLLAVPMYVLYEICIWLAWWLEKKDRAQYPEYYKDQDADAKELEVSDDWDNENYNPWSDESNDEDEESSKASAKSETPPVKEAAPTEPTPPAEPASSTEQSPAPESPTSAEPPAEGNEGTGSGTPPPNGEPGEEKRNAD